MSKRISYSGMFTVGGKVWSLTAKLVKTLKIVKVGMAAASMASYAYLFSWQFAAVIMAMLFIHESGHIWAMKRCGIPTKGIFFIPFLGGAAVASEEFGSRDNECYTAIWGPIWGGLFALTILGFYFVTRNPLFAGIASWAAFINLFQLLPVSPLDGGRIVKSIAFSFSSYAGVWVMAGGMAVCAAAMLSLHSSFFAAILVLGAFDCLIERRGYRPNVPMSGAECAWWFARYAALAGVLIMMMFACASIPGAELALQAFQDDGKESKP